MSLYSLAAVVAFVACVSGENPTSFDPPLNLPALHHKAHEVPSEQQFATACFSFIYSTLGGKQGPPKLPAAKIPEKVMAACHQSDREGCKRFGEQLQSIVEKKIKEPSKMHEKHEHLKGGKRKVKKAEKPKVVEQVVEAPKPAPVAEKKGENDYGMKVWKPKKKADKADKNSADSRLALAAHHAEALEKVTEEVLEPVVEAREKSAKMSLLAPIGKKHAPKNFIPAEYGLTEAEGRRARALMRLLGEDNHGAMLVQTSESVAPTSFNAWCTNLYAAATATWTPKK
jgi:hypothetical protein